MNAETSDWHIRLAKPEDAKYFPAIEATAATLFANVAGLESLDPDDIWEVGQLAKFIDKGHSLVAHANGTIVGFLASQPFSRELHIWEMDVTPDQQGRGIGAALLRACMIDAKNSGFVALTLSTFRDVPWNAPFYEKLGFVEVTDVEAYPRLAKVLESEAQNGLPAERRCAMIRFLD